MSTEPTTASNQGGVAKIAILLLALLVRCITALYGHSGQGKPPLYGDYEAQRHWMEITANVPVSEWYHNTSSNDLSYWGLDYPPLTAYHSYLMGLAAHRIDPSFVELFESRGIETIEHKMFMRATVLLSDLLVFFASAHLLLAKLHPSRQDYLVSLALVLLNPTLVLIDHGHFQYNCVSLGLAQLAAYWLVRGRPARSGRPATLTGLVVASVLFCLALNFKQMELYHALPFFFFMLAACVRDPSQPLAASLVHLACVATTVIATFALLWLPFLLLGPQSVLQVLSRIFPFQRGLFEDKVANFWCSLNVVVKLRERLSIDQLSKLSLLVTGLANLPSGLDLFWRPTRSRFLVCLVNSAMLFYLFSFQVHEKSILLATIPACALVISYPFLVTWFLLIANLSMLPLLYKDGLAIACIAQSLLFSLVSTHFSRQFWPQLDLGLCAPWLAPFSKPFERLLRLTFWISQLGSCLLAAGFLFAASPVPRLPDLWTVLICLFSCAHFLLFCLLFHAIQFSLRSRESGDLVDFQSCFRQKNSKKVD